MHPDSMMLMGQFVERFHERIAGKKILDVGSQDINGSYREYFTSRGCDYTGIDIVEGPNVNIITPFDRFPIEDESFDIVISGQCLEHAEKPWDLVKEMTRVLKPGGLVCWIAPWKFQVHRDALYPYDRWRILDDGMRTLILEAGLKVIDCYMYADDTVGIGEK